MAVTYKDVSVKDNVKKTVTYTCEAKKLSYTKIGDNIKQDFAFINTDLPSKMSEVLAEIEKAASVSDAFYFENGSKVSDLQNVYDEIKGDISLLENGLNELHSAFIKDIDNVNAELENNFGYWLFPKVTEAGRKEEVIKKG